MLRAGDVYAQGVKAAVANAAPKPSNGDDLVETGIADSGGTADAGATASADSLDEKLKSLLAMSPVEAPPPAPPVPSSGDFVMPDFGGPVLAGIGITVPPPNPSGAPAAPQRPNFVSGACGGVPRPNFGWGGGGCGYGGANAKGVSKGAVPRPHVGFRPVRPAQHWQGAPQPPKQSHPQTVNTVTLQGPGLQLVGEDQLQSVCQRVAIEGGFSVHEMLTIVSVGFAQLEFPHREAAAQFAKATNGQLSVCGRKFAVRHPMGGGLAKVHQEPSWSSAAATIAGANATATDVLVVKQLGQEVTESDVVKAFGLFAPRIKSAKMQRTVNGASRGMCNVWFYEVMEATNAMRYFKDSMGSMVAGRRVVVDFAQAQTWEEQMQQQASRKKTQDTMATSHSKALGGVNGDMWANYLKMFDAPVEDKREPPAEEPPAREDPTATESGNGYAGGCGGPATLPPAASTMSTAPPPQQEPEAKRARTEEYSGVGGSQAHPFGGGKGSAPGPGKAGLTHQAFGNGKGALQRPGDASAPSHACSGGKGFAQGPGGSSPPPHAWDIGKGSTLEPTTAGPPPHALGNGKGSALKPGSAGLLPQAFGSGKGSAQGPGNASFPPQAVGNGKGLAQVPGGASVPHQAYGSSKGSSPCSGGATSSLAAPNGGSMLPPGSLAAPGSTTSLSSTAQLNAAPAHGSTQFNVGSVVPATMPGLPPLPPMPPMPPLHGVSGPIPGASDPAGMEGIFSMTQGANLEKPATAVAAGQLPGLPTAGLLTGMTAGEGLRPGAVIPPPNFGFK